MEVTIPDMSKEDLDRAKLFAETVKLQAETARLNAEVSVQLRSATKTRVEYWLSPIVVLVSVIGALMTLVKIAELLG